MIGDREWIEHDYGGCWLRWCPECGEWTPEAMGWCDGCGVPLAGDEAAQVREREPEMQARMHAVLTEHFAERGGDEYG